MDRARVGVIGGSGLYQIEGLQAMAEVEVDTPFGKPSDAIVTGRLEGVEVAFLPRHGRGHRISPPEVPSRANIYALKSLGVERIIGVSAVGSLKEELRPQDIVVPDQLVDRTKGRPSTFFGNGLVVHVSFADPFCPEMRSVLVHASREAGATVHDGGTWLVMEGPQFSTRAESALHRSWGIALIGMTALPEAKLAREAEICYASIACVTDYDCWREACEPVTTEMILENLHQNVENAKRIVKIAVAHMPEQRDCDCASSLKTAIATSPDRVPEELKARLSLLIGKYLPRTA
ncbi:MAG: S-methyl-5'-thioadenosine phosphorylase [Chloroflexi bacterium]|nr:S-methyl-5'-thioadenosine phosphorylase [Chloroflexota bacterium]